MQWVGSRLVGTPPGMMAEQRALPSGICADYYREMASAKGLLHGQWQEPVLVWWLFKLLRKIPTPMMRQAHYGVCAPSARNCRFALSWPGFNRNASR